MPEQNSPEKFLSRLRLWIEAGFGFLVLVLLIYHESPSAYVEEKSVREALAEHTLERLDKLEKENLALRDAKVEDAEPSGELLWTPVFLDEFDRPELGGNWHIIKGEWGIEDGKLKIGKPVKDGLIALKHPLLSGDFQLSYRCRTLKDKGFEGKACDMSFALGVDRSPKILGRGYFFRFGSFGNTVTGLNKNGAEAIRLESPTITPGEWHTVVIQRREGVFGMAVDGEAVFAWLDRQPLGIKDAIGAFMVFMGEAEFECVMLSKPSAVEIKKHTLR